MAKDLSGRTIAFLVANEGTEQVELESPWRAAVDAGATPQLVAPTAGKVWLFNHLDRSQQRDVDQSLESTKAEEFDALVLPGGVANPDRLRIIPEAVSFVQGFAHAGKPIAAICHAPWTLVEADLVRGRTLTSWPSLRTDILNAGGTWKDEEVVICHAAPSTFTTSRGPADLKAFNSTYIDQIP